MVFLRFSQLLLFLRLGTYYDVYCYAVDDLCVGCKAPDGWNSDLDATHLWMPAGIVAFQLTLQSFPAETVW